MHTKWLKIRAMKLSILELTSQGDIVHKYLDNITCSKPVHTQCVILARSHLEEINNIAPTLDCLQEAKMSAPSGRGVFS